MKANEPLLEYQYDKDVWTNGLFLAKVMQSERTGHAKRGFFFDYGMGESMSFKNYSKQVETAAGFMMQAARDTKSKVRVFCNLNGEIACSLVN